MFKRPAHSKWFKKTYPNGMFYGRHHSDKTKKILGQLSAHNNHFGGHRHSEETKLKMSIASKKMWANPKFVLNSEEYKQKVSDRMSILRQSRTWNVYSNAKAGYKEFNGKKIYFRSSYEIVYANYLEFLVKQKQIKKWEYEVDTFWFKEILRGVRSYKPDFKLTNNNGTIEYHEVKGWMDPKSKTKLKRMKKYYPHIKVIVIDGEFIADIKKKLGNIVTK